MATGGGGSRRSGRPTSARNGGTGCCSPAARSWWSWPWCSHSCCSGRQQRLRRHRRRAIGPDRRQPHRAHRQGHLGARRDARPGGRRHGDRAAHHDQRRRADQRRQAGDALHRRGVLPLLRGRALGDDRRADPVRHVQRPGHDPVGRAQRRGHRRAVPVDRDLDVRERQLHEQVPHVHLGRGVHQHPGQGHRRLHHAADAHGRAAGAASRSTTRSTRARSRSSTTGTSS